MKQMTRMLVAVIVWGSLGAPAWAELEVKDYAKVKDSQAVQSYISGIGSGFGWANEEMTHRGQAPLYCQPPNLGIRGEQFKDILDREIADYPTISRPEFPIGLILLNGLKRTFPCKGDKP